MEIDLPFIQWDVVTDSAFCLFYDVEHSSVTLLVSCNIFLTETAWMCVYAAVEKPKFVEQLNNTDVLEGGQLHLTCSFTGQPRPQLQWLRNNEHILPSAIYRVKTAYCSRTV